MVFSEELWILASCLVSPMRRNSVLEEVSVCKRNYSSRVRLGIMKGLGLGLGLGFRVRVLRINCRSGVSAAVDISYMPYAVGCTDTETFSLPGAVSNNKSHGSSSSQPINYRKKTVFGRGRTDRISLTHDLDLEL